MSKGISNARINEYLDRFGLGHSTIAYHNLMYCIRFYIECDNIAATKLRDCYDKLAEQQGVKWESIRNGISQMLNKAGVTRTNKDFILMAVDYLVYATEEDSL